MCPTGWFIETQEAPDYLDRQTRRHPHHRRGQRHRGALVAPCLGVAWMPAVQWRRLRAEQEGGSDGAGPAGRLSGAGRRAPPAANECTACGARFFDRRNACASCCGTEFDKVDVATEGVVRAFTIVSFAAPGIPVPFVAGGRRLRRHERARQHHQRRARPRARARSA